MTAVARLRHANCVEAMSEFEGRSQPVDATLYLEREMECGLMVHRFHRGFTAAEKRSYGIAGSAESR